MTGNLFDSYASAYSSKQALQIWGAQHGAGHPGKTRAGLENLLRQTSPHAPGLHLPRVTLHDSDGTEQVACHVQQALAIATHDGQFAANPGGRFRRPARLDEAICPGEQAASRAHANLGAADYEVGNPDRARARHQAALALDAALATCSGKLDRFYRARQNREGTLRQNRSVLEIDPPSLKAANNLGSKRNACITEVGQLGPLLEGVKYVEDLAHA